MTGGDLSVGGMHQPVVWAARNPAKGHISYEAVVLGPDGSELNVTTLTITE